jgi:inositol phosphorylceramide mannosyltransferase catalytic subunit
MSRMQSRIPKRILQTGKNVQLSLLQRAAVSNVKLLNPGFDYLFFDDRQVAAFFDQEAPEYREFVALLRYPIQKYDFFRYLAVYRHGGFYFDLDVFLASDLDPLLEHGCVFSFEDLNISRFLREDYSMDWAVGNYAFGAAQGHPFLKAVIDNCVRAQKEPKWVEPMMRGIPRLFHQEFLILNTTGPLLVSRTLAENPALAENVTVLFPDDVCESRNWHNFGNFGVHLMEASWRTKYGRVRRRLASIWEVWTYKRLFKQSVRLGKTRQFRRNGQ